MEIRFSPILRGNVAGGLMQAKVSGTILLQAQRQPIKAMVANQLVDLSGSCWYDYREAREKTEATIRDMHFEPDCDYLVFYIYAASKPFFYAINQSRGHIHEANGLQALGSLPAR